MCICEKQLDYFSESTLMSVLISAHDVTNGCFVIRGGWECQLVLTIMVESLMRPRDSGPQFEGAPIFFCVGLVTSIVNGTNIIKINLIVQNYHNYSHTFTNKKRGC